MDVSYLSSSAGIVAATMLIVEVLKRLLGNQAVFRSAPTWTVACTVSGALTGVGLYVGLLQEPGPWYAVLGKVLGLAATASGFWTWLRAPNDQLQDSEAAMRARMRSSSLVVLVLAGGLVLTGCGANPSPALTPAQAEQAKLREIARVASVMQRVGTLVETLQTTEIAFHQAGRVSREDHRVVQLSLRITSDVVIDALERMKDLTQSDASRRQWLTVARGAVERLINEGIVPLVDPDARIELRLLATAISSILFSFELMVDATPGHPPRARAAAALEPFTLEASWQHV